MTPPRTAWTAAALVAALGLVGCGGAQRAAAPSPRPEPRYPHTEADVRFMSAMIGHHAQAVLIAGWVPTHDASASIRTLAERIASGQQDEIATMEQWLRDRGQPVPEAGTGGTTMTHDAHHQMPMPGMLTEAQLRQLDQARGPEFDRLFLTFMIQHHRGAVAMVQELFGSPAAAQDDTVFKFANDVSADQSTEIARMERMLAALPPAERSP